MTDTTPRYLVTSYAAATRVLRKLARDGWTARQGFVVTDQHWDVSADKLVRHGRVTDPETARLALLAAARGAGVVIVTDPTTNLGQALHADLARIGPVALAPHTEPDPHPGPDALAPEQRALLDRLAAGETIAAAATAEYLSLRTANRRIAQARTILGVRTTREAVLAYLRLHRGS